RPDAANAVRRPDEVRRAVERRHEVVRDRRQLSLLAVPLRREVEPALGGRIDDGALDGVERALRERREGADRLDLVAEELDPQRLTSRRREHVDQAAADGELAAVVDALDAFVAGERQALGEELD